MGIIGGALGYRLLRAISAGGEYGHCDGSAYAGRSKLEVLFGPEIWSEIAGRTVIDFGCGTGRDAVEMAKRGAKRVIGIDIRDNVLAEARRAAARERVADRCAFTVDTDERGDVLVSLDAFEHFHDPRGVLRRWRELVNDGAAVRVVFGPTWYHPLGGHLFSVFPWAHLIFTERALIRWRADFKLDGATRFSEVEGGLNQMTIRRFEKLVAESEFRFDRLELVPIRRLAPLANRLTREFTTAIVRARLLPRERAQLHETDGALLSAGRRRGADEDGVNTPAPEPGRPLTHGGPGGERR